MSEKKNNGRIIAKLNSIRSKKTSQINISMKSRPRFE